MPTFSRRPDYQLDDDAGPRPANGFEGSKRLVTMLIIVGVLFAAWRASGVSQALAWHDNVDDAIDIAAAKKKPILAYFTADWCGPCQSFKKNVLTDGDVKRKLESFVLVQIDLSQPTGPGGRVAQKLGVRSIPTFIIYDADGRQVDTATGAMPTEYFLQWLESCQAKAK